jgi:hypothetical protein
MKNRGINNPEELLRHAGAPAILGACRWFDEKPNAGPGLLAKVIREGGMPEMAPTAEPACPCTCELCQEWQLVLVELERVISEDDWIMRYAPWVPLLHPHSRDGQGWTLGAESWVPAWFGERRDGLRKAAGCPVAIVACEEEGGGA